MSEPTQPGGTGARRLRVLGLVLAAFAAASIKVARRLPPAPFRSDRTATAGPNVPTAGAAPADRPVPRFRSDFVSTRKFTQSHAVSLVDLGGGRIRAFWYSGTREGASDVTIQTAVFDPRSGHWSPERTVADREATQRALWRHVAKLGNPVASRAFDGTLRLFYVTVSVGGWSGSSLTMITSRDDGETWSQPRRIITSPFLNLSTLVKGTPFAYADGTLGLPVYEEFLGKFGELLRLDASGSVIDKTRLSFGRHSLQPIVLVEDAARALVLMRYSGSTRPNRVISTATDDSGLDWSRPVKSSLSNPDAALSGVVLADGRILVVLNDDEYNRDALSLAVSGDGGASWKTIYKLEDESAPESRRMDEAHYRTAIESLARASDETVVDADAYFESAKRPMRAPGGYIFEFSYPYLIRTSLGDYHLAYTWNRAFIKHIEFNQAWLDQRLE